MFDFPEKIGITIYQKDRKLCHVVLDGETVVAETYPLYNESVDWKHYLNFVDNPTREAFLRFLMKRVPSQSLWRWRQIFNSVGLDEYLPYAFIRKVHGVLNADGMWFYFDDDWLDESFRPPIYMEQGFPLRE